MVFQNCEIFRITAQHNPLSVFDELITETQQHVLQIQSSPLSATHGRVDRTNKYSMSNKRSKMIRKTNAIPTLNVPNPSNVRFSCKRLQNQGEVNY